MQKSIENRRFRTNGASLDQNFRCKVSPPSTILPVRKLDKQIWYENFGSRSFRFVTKHAFDRRTDGQTDRQKCDSIHSRTVTIQLHPITKRLLSYV